VLFFYRQPVSTNARMNSSSRINSAAIDLHSVRPVFFFSGILSYVGQHASDGGRVGAFSLRVSIGPFIYFLLGAIDLTSKHAGSPLPLLAGRVPGRQSAVLNL